MRTKKEIWCLQNVIIQGQKAAIQSQEPAKSNNTELAELTKSNDIESVKCDYIEPVKINDMEPIKSAK